MRRAILVAVLGGLFVALSAGVGIAQQEPQTIDLTVNEVDASAHPEVTITVTVPFELAADVFTLSDFFVAENGISRDVRVQQVPGDRLGVVLALDTSGSMRGAPLAEAKNAINAFVDQMPPGVAFALVQFGSSSELVVPFTTDPAEIQSALAGLQAVGETALYDALIEAGELFDGLEGVRRSLILLSDGGDTASVASLEQAIVAMLTAEAEVVAVELESPENDSASLQRLQISTQGEVVAASNPEALEGIFGTLASDLLNQFRIFFTSEQGGNTELTVAVRGENISALSTSSVRFPVLAGAVTETSLPAATTIPPPTTTLAPVALEALPGSAVELPWYQSSGALTVVAVLMFLALFGVFALARPPQVSGGVAALRGIAKGRSGGKRSFGGIADRASLLAEGALDRTGGSTGLRLLLDQAGLNLRVGEFAVILLAIVLGGLFVGNLLLGLAGMFIGVVLGLLLPIGVVSAIGQQRAVKFRGQLADTLQLMAGALRAGFGINQAVDSVAAEAPEPAASEFGRVSVEVQLGRELESALGLMAERVQSEDLRMAAEAVEIHRQVGGDLAELLERVAETIRERENIRRQIQVLSAEGRISAVVLVVLPVFIAGIVRVVSPEYLTALTETGQGQVMIVVGVVLMLIGVFWLRRIVQLRF